MTTWRFKRDMLHDLVLCTMLSVCYLLFRVLSPWSWPGHKIQGYPIDVQRFLRKPWFNIVWSTCRDFHMSFVTSSSQLNLNAIFGPDLAGKHTQYLGPRLPQPRYAISCISIVRVVSCHTSASSDSILVRSPYLSFRHLSYNTRT